MAFFSGGWLGRLYAKGKTQNNYGKFENLEGRISNVMRHISFLDANANVNLEELHLLSANVITSKQWQQ